MPRKYTPRPTKHWSSSALEDAVAERKVAGISYRKLFQKYNVPRSTLVRHMKQDVGRQGRKNVCIHSWSKRILMLCKYMIEI